MHWPGRAAVNSSLHHAAASPFLALAAAGDEEVQDATLGKRSPKT